MREIDDAALVATLGEAAKVAASQEFQSLVTVASLLRAIAADDDDPLRAIVAGLEYHLVMDDERRAPHGPFGPMIESSGGSYPAPLDRIDALVPGAYALWEQTMRLSPLPLIRARFADLLWEVRHGGRPHELAQIAVDSYVDAANGEFGRPVERSEAVQRAVEIASMINDRQRRASAIDAAAALCKSSIASNERMPGVALRLLELFVNDDPARRPTDLRQLLDDAESRFGDDPWNLESVLDLQARLKPPEEQRAVSARAVEAFRELARRSTGLVKYAHLQHAIELAEEHGLRPLSDEVRRELEQIQPEELDLTVVSAEVSIPSTDVEAYIDRFVGDDDVESALTRFGALIPTGEPESNRRFVEQLMSEHPLQFLVTKMTIGPENSLIRSTQGEAAQAEQALIDHEAQRASVFSLFAVEILRRIGERYGAIGDATDWFESDLIERPVAVKIGRAIEHYEGGDFDSAASVLVPRLERIIRRLAAAAGLTVTRSPDTRGRSGGVKGLGEILASLDGLLHEPTRRYLRVLLPEVTALNLRNRVGHGLDDEIAQRETSLLIHAACHLRLLTSRDRAEDR
jgi:Domain of unknown function (DUF4209)